jgi:hypothetical protein
MFQRGVCPRSNAPDNTIAAKGITLTFAQLQAFLQGAFD